MAGPFFVDDGGDGSTENSWATADTSINDLDAEYAFAANEIIYFGADSQCQASNSANLTITGPSTGIPCYMISSAVGSGTTVSYVASTSKQIDVTESTYDLLLNGTFSLYGISIAVGRDIKIRNSYNSAFFAHQSRFAVGANGQLIFDYGYAPKELNNCVIDLTADGTTTRTKAVILLYGSNTHEFTGLTFVNAGYRTGTVIDPTSGNSQMNVASFIGCDFSGFTNGTLCELVLAAANGLVATFSNCLTAATWAPLSAAQSQYGRVTLTNCGPADDPTYLYDSAYQGLAVSTTSIYRTGGATVEGTALAILVTTSAVCGENNPFYLPWIYGTVDSTGSKTFTCYITNDTADFTDANVWLEVEYLKDADEALWTLATDQRATITTTAAGQTDDTTSTWNGTGPSFTYKQSLAVTATVGETGQYRARVAVGVASVAGSRYFYVDPKVTVS